MDYYVVIKLVHFSLHPETPVERQNLQELFGCGVEEIKAKNIQMKGLIAAKGLKYNYRSNTYNRRLAEEIGTLAEMEMGTNTINDKYYRAYFVHGLNLGDINVIIEIAKSICLAEQGARAVIAEHRYKDAVDAD